MQEKQLNPKMTSDSEKQKMGKLKIYIITMVS